MFDLSSSSLLHLSVFLRKLHALLLFPFFVIASSPLKSQYSVLLSFHSSFTNSTPTDTSNPLSAYFSAFISVFKFQALFMLIAGVFPQTVFIKRYFLWFWCLFFCLFVCFNSHSPPSSVIICSLSEWVYSLTLTLGPFIFSGPLALMACHLFSDLSKHISRFSF